MGIKREMLLLPLAGLIYLSLLIGDVQAKEIIILGGDEGKSWEEGGGGITPVFIVGPKEVELGNTPGGVIDFNFEDRIAWVFPEKAEPTKNIALGLIDRGGSIEDNLFDTTEGDLIQMIDNNAETAFERKSTELKTVFTFGVIVTFDLGSRFGVGRLKFFPRNADPDFAASDFPFQDDFIRAYEIFFNDGSEETQSGGRPIFTSFLLEQQNDQAVVDLSIVPQYIRFIRIRSQTTVGFEISEFQVFGVGFVPVAEYQSDIFDLGEGLALWGNIRWEEDIIGDAVFSGAAIRTRSGIDDTPVVFNRIRDDLAEVPWKREGDLEGSREREIVAELDSPDLSVREAMLTFSELTPEERNSISLARSDHKSLPSTKKGSVRDDIENWSLWTPPYSSAGIVTSVEVAAGEGGVRILSPGSRRFFQVKIDFSNDELFASRGIGTLSFDFSSPPLAEEILAEISPRQVDLGEITEFSYWILPNIRPGFDKGFNSFEITTPVRVTSIDKIEMTFPDRTRVSEEFSDADLINLPVRRGNFSIDFVEEDRFRISFPKVENSNVETREMTTVNVTFKGVVLRIGTAFTGKALNSLTGELELPQEVIGANVVDLSKEELDVALLRNQANLVVQVAIEDDLLINVQAVPNPFTPNGDGINDFTDVNYDITSLTSKGKVTVGVYDLSGRLLKELYSGSDASGSYSSLNREQLRWDGRDKDGNLLPPGIYIFRVEIDADADNEGASGTVAIVY